MHKNIIRARGVILCDDKMLLVKMPQNNFYCLPGGNLEYGEGIEECVERELFEELGVKPQIGNLLYVNIFLSDDTQNIDFIFEVLNGKDFIDLDEKERTHAFEISDIVWANRGDDIKILPEKLKYDFDNNEILSNKVRFIK